MQRSLIQGLVVVFLLLSGIVAMRWDWIRDAEPTVDNEPTIAKAAPNSAAENGAWLQTYEELLAARDPRIGFRLEFADQTRTSFHMGEVIDLRMVFSCTEGGVYEIDLALYDRSGRIPGDVYCVDRASDTDDPMWEILRYSFFFGGARAVPHLAPGVEETVVMNLNQYIRFNRTGRFRLYVTTDRFSPITESPNFLTQPEPDLVASDVLEIEILPRDRHWESKELDRICIAIDSAIDDYDESEEQAVQSLRHLGTEASTRELAKRIAVPSAHAGSYLLGLLSTRHRELALDTMKSIIEDPEVPIYDDLISAYNTLDAMHRNVRFHQNLNSGYALLEGALATKISAARGICEITLAGMEK